YIVRGGPGTGKTTIGLHFLSEGIRRGEIVLYVTLEESEEKVRTHALTLGIDIEKMHFLDMSPQSDLFRKNESYDIFSPAEVEREPTNRIIAEIIEKLKPSRIFLDPVTQFRYLSPDLFQYRSQILSFMNFLRQQRATVLFSSEFSPEAPDDDLLFIADGVINLINEEHGRYIQVQKLRDSGFKEGRHSLKLTEKGAVVYEHLRPMLHRVEVAHKRYSSGIPELDELLHGGIEAGTITLVTGPSGAGKTTLGMQFVKESAARGERSVVFSFDEEKDLIIHRCSSLGIPVIPMQEKGLLDVIKIEPLQYSSDEFADLVRKEVEINNAKLVMIDSTAGYRLSVKGENVAASLHAIAKYLQYRGVFTILVNEMDSVIGDFSITEDHISYLADNIVFLRYFEASGQIHRAIGVLKKRLGSFEHTLRELEITKEGIKLGKPLDKFRGILSGTPSLNGIHD
ncbi:MAG: hypothetical protein N3A02_03735, partial [Rectinema sp.]|nr:hypothetical protein [Rectinema sp.]